MEPIYLDHNATTPVDPEVREAILPFLGPEFGNPSSGHIFGRRARAAVTRAREQAAALIGALPDEIIFTSGGTEASHLALLGAAEALRERRPGGRLRIASFVLEHPATLVPLEELRRRGDEIRLARVDPRGVVDLPELLGAVRGPEPADLVSLMLAHNETGAIQPVEEVGRAARAVGAIYHVDAAQAAGKVPVRVDAIGCDLLSIVGHKLYAPKGIGLLYIRAGTPVRALVGGAGQEHGLRGGTENVPGIIGLGAACAVASRRLAEGESKRIAELRDRLWDRLHTAIPGIARTSEGVPTLPNTLHVRFPGASGNAVLSATPEVAASTGSACHSGIDRPPPAILALGVPEDEAVGSVRLSLGHGTDPAAVESAADHLIRGWQAARGGNREAPRR
jgi:cysteine desulfurase